MSAVNSSSVRTNQLCSGSVSVPCTQKKIKHHAVNKWENIKMRELKTLTKQKYFLMNSSVAGFCVYLRFKTKFYLL